MKVKINCNFCNKVFFRKKGDINFKIKNNKTGNQYCSRKCADDYRSIQSNFHKYPRLFRIHSNLKYRCLSPACPNFKNYGGRGIAFHASWHSCKVFIEWAINNGYNDNLSLERINNDGNYEPSNCKWATRKEQCQNRRNNKRIMYNGENLTISEWNRRLGGSSSLITNRLKAGWDEIKAVSTPVTDYCRNNIQSSVIELSHKQRVVKKMLDFGGVMIKNKRGKRYSLHFYNNKVQVLMETLNKLLDNDYIYKLTNYNMYISKNLSVEQQDKVREIISQLANES